MNWLILRGVQEAAALNVITTIAKLIPLLVFVIAIIFIGAFDPKVFMSNFWGSETADAPAIADQIKATTSATVWSFIGVEGAVVLSARAKRSSDVGKASLTGFLGIFIIYVLVAVLSMGVLTTEELAALKNPQMAGILEAVVGPWGAALVNIGVILSLAGALLGWTILAADCPYSAAKQGVFMHAFTRANENGSPSFSLYLTNGLVQLFLIVIYFSASTYQVFYTFSTTMIMIPYFLSALYYMKVAARGEGFSNSGGRGGSLGAARFFAFVGTLYGIWMLYSSGLELTFIACILYAPGIIVFALGKKEKGRPVFERPYEAVIAIALALLAVIALFMIITGRIHPF